MFIGAPIRICYDPDVITPAMDINIALEYEYHLSVRGPLIASLFY
jgi:hypothetical protein